MYPIRLAEFLNRSDLFIVSRTFLQDENWYGLPISTVILDHGAELSRDESFQLNKLLRYVMKNNVTK